MYLHARKLQELGYKNLYIDGVNVANKWKYDPKAMEKTPGLNFNSKRVQIIAAFEESLRHNFNVRSSRLLNELNTFVYVNGRPDHLKGQHDDLIMAMAMAIYVGENSFTQLEKVTEQTKAMIESWAVHETPIKNPVQDYSPTLAYHLTTTLMVDIKSGGQLQKVTMKTIYGYSEEKDKRFNY